MPEDKEIKDGKEVEDTTPDEETQEPEFDLDAAKQRVADKVIAGEPLTNADTLLAQGLVEVYDPAVSAYRQVAVEDAKKMIKANKELAKSLKGL